MTPLQQYEHIQQHHQIYQDLVQQGYLEPIEAYDLVAVLAQKFAQQNNVPTYWREYMPTELKAHST